MLFFPIKWIFKFHFNVSVDVLSIPIWDINSSSNYFSLKCIANYSKGSLAAQWNNIFFEGLEFEELFIKSKVVSREALNKGFSLQTSHRTETFLLQIKAASTCTWMKAKIFQEKNRFFQCVN